MRKVIQLALLSAALLPVTRSMAVDYVWNVSIDGLWTTNANWNPNTGNPSVAADTATIAHPGGAASAVNVTLNASRSISAVTVNASTGGTNQLTIANNTVLALATGLTNNGQVNIVSAGNVSSLSLLNNLSFNGTGKVVLSGNNAARITTAAGTPTLTNTATHTIEGRGLLGMNSLGFVNAGTIDASVSGTTLVLDPADALGLSNAGLLRARAGATLSLQAATYTNSGSITADGAGSTVLIDNFATIVGGTVRGINGGVVQVGGSQNGFFQNVTFTGSIRANNNSDFGITGTITNNGTISIESTGNATEVEVQAGGATLAGSGTLTLGGTSVNAGINGVGGMPTLTNSATHRIDGKGRFGQNTIGIDNNGLIVATNAATSLDLDPGAASLDANGSDFINTGTLRADAGATLQLLDGLYRNDNVISADGVGAQVVFAEGVTIRGGTVRGINGGVASVNNNINAFFENVTFTGSIRANNNSDFGITGTITNNGTISIESTGNITDVEVQAGGATLAGSGTLTLGGTSVNAGINGVAGMPTLTNSATHRIDGKGRLGQNTIGIDNKGLIVATNTATSLDLDPGAASLDANGSDFINTGTLRADAGATLQFLDGLYRNDNVISADGVGAQVVFAGGATIRGGTVRGINGGVAFVSNSVNAFFENVTFTGSIRGNNNVDFGITGTITNNGTILMESLGNFTDVEVQAAGATLAGSGTLTLGGTSVNAGINGVAGMPTLTNSATHRIDGKGRIGQNTLDLINFGTIVATDATAALSIDPGAGPFEQRGFLRAQGGGGLELDSGTHNLLLGTVQIDAASKLVINSGAVVNLEPTATLTQNGALTINGGGTLNNKGSFSPGVGAAGLVTLNGTFINSPGATLTMNLGGQLPAEYDRMAGSGGAQLAGTLALNLINGFDPALYGGVMTLIDDTGTQISGRFGSVTGWNLSPQKKLAVIYGPVASATLLAASEVFVVAAIPGDTNADAKVNFDDLLAVARSYNLSGTWQNGDFDYTGTVTFDDLLKLAQVYGYGTLLSSPDDFAADWALAQSLVPEPVSGLALLALVRPRRRRA